MLDEDAARRSKAATGPALAGPKSRREMSEAAARQAEEFQRRFVRFKHVPTGSYCSSTASRRVA